MPAFQLISPKVDPDLLPLVRHRERPELRREIHAYVGELPLPAERFVMPEAETTSLSNKTNYDSYEDKTKVQFKEPNDSMDGAVILAKMKLPSRYPRGKRY